MIDRCQESSYPLDTNPFPRECVRKPLGIGVLALVTPGAPPDQVRGIAQESG